MPDHHHDATWIVAEYCDKGTLAHLVPRYKASQRPIPDLFAWQVLQSLARAVHYCHHGPSSHDGSSTPEPWDEITHREIILGNIFLKTSGENNNQWEYPITVKLGDWGCAIFQSEWMNREMEFTDLAYISDAYELPDY